MLVVQLVTLVLGWSLSAFIFLHCIVSNSMAYAFKHLVRLSVLPYNFNDVSGLSLFQTICALVCSFDYSYIPAIVSHLSVQFVS